MATTGNVFVHMQTGEMPIVITTVTGTVLTVHATQDTLEGYYGSVHSMVDKAIKPLTDVASIVVHVFDEFFGEVVPVTTYSQELEAFCAADARVDITYNLFGTGSETVEQGFLDIIDGWLPRYGIRYHHTREATLYPIVTEDIERIALSAHKASQAYAVTQ